jgi:ketosteroid isomerase-like protein
MKVCPVCQRSYTDDSLNFCLQDGSPLARASEVLDGPGARAAIPDDETTVDRKGGSPTEVLARQSAKTELISGPVTTAPAAARPTIQSSQDPGAPPRSRQNALIVLLSVLVLLLLVALAGFGAWLALRDRQSRGPVVVRQDNSQTNGAETLNLNGIVGAKPNSNRSSTNGQINANSLAPASTPTPVDTSAIRDQVVTTVNGWASATRARDIDAHMSYYADRLDVYYKASNVSSSRVRADREKAYAVFSSLDVRLTNIKVTPDPAGQRASAIFDKTWNFTGEKYSSGSVQQMMWFEKTGGRWLITGEKELQVYYVNR